MDFLTKKDLMELIEIEAEWCVSMYVPMVRAGAEVQQNPIRFKNLLRKAESHLEKLGMRPPDVEDLLYPASAMLDDLDLWQSGDGLAVFVAPDTMRYLRLPISPEDFVVVKRRFHVKPLLSLLAGDGRFYVLALGQEDIRLLEGTRDSVTEVELAGVPASLAETLAYEVQRDHMRAVGGGASGAVFHGSGGSDTEKKQIRRYFQRVDQGLRDLIADKQIPLVLAGMDFMLPLYREANTYPHLLDDDLPGNPHAISAKDLHKRAWELVKPIYARTQDEQRGTFLSLAGRDDQRASTSLKQTMLAAHQGRVATLWVPVGRQLWGRFDAERPAVHVHAEMEPGDQDLLDLLAARTFASGGLVYAVAADAIPGGGDFAAILRY